MRILFVGDVFATPGMKAAMSFIADRREDHDLVVVNGENAAGGFGITRRHFEQLIGAGADVVTLGNHSFDQGETLEMLEESTRLLRPANLPVGTPGAGHSVVHTRSGERVVVVQVLGRIFMDPVDDPFRTMDEVLELAPPDVPVVVDFHAEATSEKKVMLHHLAGRVALLIGTHTHVQTADETVYKGTAYITDVGMTGVQGSSIGMRYEDVFHRLVTKLPRRYRPAEGQATVCAVSVEISGTRAASIQRLWAPQPRDSAVEAGGS
ncbi:MAG TPA: TIGR00282 family metallophosphoesterase [Trueperaceae bacterium]|nr:TIGR00282 family metallophosphoesterase [Trueperaceae bacterium]